MQVKRVQDYISKEWFDETDGSYFERLNSRLQVLLKKITLIYKDMILLVISVFWIIGWFFLMKLLQMLMRKRTCSGNRSRCDQEFIVRGSRHPGTVG